MKQAWVGAYGAITEIMLKGADYSKEDIALSPSQEIATDDRPIWKVFLSKLKHKIKSFIS